MIIIHHNDSDGIGSAAIVARSKWARNIDGTKKNITFFEMSHSDLSNEAKINEIREAILSGKHDTLFIVDFSLPESLIKEFEPKIEIHWIDHHAHLKDTNKHLKGLRDFTNKGKSGCELAWEYCKPKDNPNIKTPEIVQLIGDFDTKREKLKDSNAFNLAFDMYKLRPDSKIWDDQIYTVEDNGDELTKQQIHHNMREFVKVGEYVSQYRDSYNEKFLKSYGFETTFENIKCFCGNLVGGLSFKNKLKEYDVCIGFVFNGKEYTISLYSDNPDIDCGAICKKYGGGGHRGAAGFRSKNLPFN